MKKLMLVCGVVIGLFAGCAGEEAAPAAELDQAALAERAELEAAIADEAVTFSTSAAFGYVCKGLKSACCEPIGTNSQGQTVCLSKIWCVQNPIVCP
jgi:hypothetical protein